MDRTKQKRDSLKRRRMILRLKVIEYLSNHPCVVCGETDPIVLEFDHLERDTKVLEVSRMVNNRSKWSLIEEEINKCQVLCCNCHRRKTHIQLSYWK